jgi:hypothetical protein
MALETGNSRAYLKSVSWWLGMLCMALGECSNFIAYAFSPAIIVAPLMAVSVVVRYEFFKKFDNVCYGLE